LAATNNQSVPAKFPAQIAKRCSAELLLESLGLPFLALRALSQISLI